MEIKSYHLSFFVLINTCLLGSCDFFFGVFVVLV